MSSTRRSTDGLFHQERFCSAPEFGTGAINGLAAAKRIAIVKNRAVREVLWFIQWRSLTPSGLQELCDQLITEFPARVGTPTLRKLSASTRTVLKEKEIRALRSECGSTADINALFYREFKLSEIPVEEWKLPFYRECALSATAELPQLLIQFCLDPGSDISKGVWFFDDLLGAVIALRDRFIAAAQARLADTIVTSRINETLDFSFARRRLVLIEGVAGIGRTATTRAWCDAHAGLARHVEVPSSSDDRSFFASIARELGVARGMSMKAQEIKVRVEEMLFTGELMLVLDEAQYLFGQYFRPRRTPDRLLWVKSVFDAGTPLALVAHTDFSKWQALFVDKTKWTDEQFVRRLNRHVTLPAAHSREDMLKIARAYLPHGEQRSWNLLAAYALGTKKKQASGIVEALESARYRAEKDGRDKVTFADIEAALVHDHQFLQRPTADDLQTSRITVAKRVKRRRNNEFRAPLSDFPIPVRLPGGRVTTSIDTT